MQVLLTLQVLSHIIEGSGITEFQKLQMQENITTFEDILGGCERLLRTPIPVSYTRHTSRFLIIWLTILPYALWSKLGWATVPASAMISLLLLGTSLSDAALLPFPFPCGMCSESDKAQWEDWSISGVCSRACCGSQAVTFDKGAKSKQKDQQ
jgi:hypothetical protein